MGKVVAGLKTIVEIMMLVRTTLEALKGLLELFKEAQRQGRVEEIRNAFKEASTGNTIALEKAIGSINAGKPTTNPHDDIKERPARDRGEP